MEIIEKQLESHLLERGESRKYAVQTLLPTASQPKLEDPSKDGEGASAKKPNVYAHQLVRTDCKSQKLDAFFEISSRSSVSGGNDASENATSDDKNNGDLAEQSVELSVAEMGAKRKHSELPESSMEKKSRPSIDVQVWDGTNSNVDESMVNDDTTSSATEKSKDSSKSISENPDQSLLGNEKDDDENDDGLTMGFNEPRRRPILLRSVRELGEEIHDTLSSDLKTLFRDSVFVGCVSRRHALLQHSTCLYLVNMEKVSAELFYQIMIADFANFGLMRLSTPAPIYELTLLALDLPESGWSPADEPKEKMAEFCRNLLVSKKEMLEEYFSMEIDAEGNVR